MLNPQSRLAALLAAPMRPGRVLWIGLRPARRSAVLTVEEALAQVGQGLAGDRYGSRDNGPRQVTLIQAEHLAAIASHLGLEQVEPARLRRNVVTQGINLLALKERRFRLGGAVLEHTGECHPCSRMEEELGPGGYNAVRGHGGITARVIEPGPIRSGDAITAL
ncbi:MOSC domain-containing protein [Rubellimicrobium roseum]|uniref:MOSC domain-containing protein n=1 Tax=Rubellimicrobium roseum TaxID=687525 RepID=A0A5C4NA76_9RHOB|nr:MOSC domain-containing protein [Rubellimicrobium roseum]TNC65020.1 MOSC domain-containing protein [Rubellimicrobium roseum]